MPKLKKLKLPVTPATPKARQLSAESRLTPRTLFANTLNAERKMQPTPKTPKRIKTGRR